MAYVRKGREGQKEWLRSWNKSDKKRELNRQYFFTHNPVYKSGIVEKIQAKKEKKGTLSRLGVKLSEDTKRKIGLSKLGKKRKPFSEEWKRKLGLANRGKRLSEERIARIRARRIKQVLPTKNTSIELKLQNLLKENNIEFETHYPILGQPDIFIKPNICIFADGDYWHNTEKSKVRDEYVNRELQSQGYIIIRLWEHEINKKIDDCLLTITRTVQIT